MGVVRVGCSAGVDGSTAGDRGGDTVSVYDNDSRVKRISDYRYDVLAMPSETPIGIADWHPNDGWAAIRYGDPVGAPTFATADDAIRRLIGDPQ
jgi:hypothetical protein